MTSSSPHRKSFLAKAVRNAPAPPWRTRRCATRVKTHDCPVQHMCVRRKQLVRKTLNACVCMWAGVKDIDKHTPGWIEIKDVKIVGPASNGRFQIPVGHAAKYPYTYSMPLVYFISLLLKCKYWFKICADQIYLCPPVNRRAGTHAQKYELLPEGEHRTLQHMSHQTQATFILWHSLVTSNVTAKPHKKVKLESWVMELNGAPNYHLQDCMFYLLWNGAPNLIFAAPIIPIKKLL